MMRRGDAIVPERDESKAAEREQPVHKLLDLGGNPVRRQHAFVRRGAVYAHEGRVQFALAAIYVPNRNSV